MVNTIWPTAAQAMAHANTTAVAPLTWDPTNHLLSRFSFGPTAAERAWVAAKGPDAWYANQIAVAKSAPFYAGHAGVAAEGPLLALNPYDLRQSLKTNGNEYAWDGMVQLGRVTLGLQTWSNAQLFETLVDFFANHLNVPNHSDSMWVTRAAFDRNVIRLNALGSFTDMLVASARHPAMLTYLNLADSTKTAVNENYGRELLELHTVGLNYSEDDVKNAARLLTGRTTNDNFHYLFDDYIHPTGPVQVLNFTAANAAPTDGLAASEDYIKYLAAHPLTASRLARKLCVRYVSDSPSDELVAAVAKAYLDNKTKILPMISTILRSTDFWESRGQKVRRPTENLIATIRVLGLTPTKVANALNTLDWMTNSLGNRPLDCPTPNGYADVASAWRSSGTLLNLWNLHLGAVGGWYDGFSTADLTALYGGVTPATSGEAIDLLCKGITGMTFSTGHKTALQTFLKEPGTTPMSKSVLRYWLNPLVALILDSPQHALR